MEQRRAEERPPHSAHHLPGMQGPLHPPNMKPAWCPCACAGRLIRSGSPAHASLEDVLLLRRELHMQQASRGTGGQLRWRGQAQLRVHMLNAPWSAGAAQLPYPQSPPTLLYILTLILTLSARPPAAD